VLSGPGWPQIVPDLLTHALDASSEAVEIADVNRSILYVNDAWCRLFRRARREVIGVTWDSLEASDTQCTELRTTWLRCISVGSSRGAHEPGLTGSASFPIDYARSLYGNTHQAAAAVVTVYRPAAAPTVTGAPAPQFRTLEHSLRNVFASINGARPAYGWRGGGRP
jgi:PAS domain-containing protein